MLAPIPSDAGDSSTGENSLAELKQNDEAAS